MSKSFIDMMVEYYELLSDGDPIFMEFGAAQMLGFLLGKKSVVNITPQKEQLNLYTLYVSESYYGRKNVAQDIIKSFYPLDKLLANETSSEKFIANLAENPDGIWFAGEFSKIMKHANKMHYLSDIIETMNDLYNYKHTTYTRTLMKNDYVIFDAYPSFNSTLTPSVLKEQVTKEMLEGGFFGRLILVPGRPATGEVGRKAVPPEAEKMKKELQSIVDYIYDMIKIRKKHIEFHFDNESLQKLNEIERKLAENKVVRSIAGRYGQAIIKLAAIICFSRSIGEIIEKNSIFSNISNVSNVSKVSKFKGIFSHTYFTYISEITNFTIFSADLEKAYEMISASVDFAEQLYIYSDMNKKHIIKVKEYVEKNHPVLRSDVSRFCNLDAQQMKDAEDTLEKIQDTLKIIRFQKVKKNGTKSKMKTVYCLNNIKKTECNNCEYQKYCEKI